MYVYHDDDGDDNDDDDKDNDVDWINLLNETNDIFIWIMTKCVPRCPIYN